MFHAILITGYDPLATLKLAQKISLDSLAPSPDVYLPLFDPSTGIAEIKKVIKFLSRKPMFKPNKIAFFPMAERMTLPAQNAFLKTLEEPPAHSLMILIAPHSDRLLPTLVSRCRLYRLTDSLILSPSVQQEQADIFSQISVLPLEKKLTFINQYAGNKIEALKFCQNQLILLRSLFIDQNQLTLIPTIKMINQTIKYLNQNVNPKLCLENLCFTYPKPKKLAKV